MENPSNNLTSEINTTIGRKGGHTNQKHPSVPLETLSVSSKPCTRNGTVDPILQDYSPVHFLAIQLLNWFYHRQNHKMMDLPD